MTLPRPSPSCRSPRSSLSTSIANEWKRRIIEASGLYASDPEVESFAEHVQYSIANIRGIAFNRYLVNTEGTMVRQGYTGYNGSHQRGRPGSGWHAPQPRQRHRRRQGQRPRERRRLSQTRHRRP